MKNEAGHNFNTNDENSFLEPLISKINFYELSSNKKFLKTIFMNLKNSKKVTLHLNSILSNENFFKYDYKNVKDALFDLKNEANFLTFYPYFRLSEEKDYPIKSVNKIEFDMILSFNKKFIKNDSPYLNTLDEKIIWLDTNNKSIVPFFLYRKMKEDRSFFYPIDLIINNLENDIIYEESLINIFKNFIVYEENDADITSLLINHLGLKEKNSYISFLNTNYNEGEYLNTQEIEELSNYGINAKKSKLIFLRNTSQFNMKFPTLLEEIIDNFQEFLENNKNIKNQLQKDLPIEKKDDVYNINKFNFEELILTILDPNNSSKYNLTEKQRKEFLITSKYIFENEKNLLDNIDFDSDNKNLSLSLKEEIIGEFKKFFNKERFFKPSFNKNISLYEYNIIYNYSELMSELYNYIKKDKSIITKIFNEEVKNKWLFFRFFKKNDILDTVEFFADSFDLDLVIFPIEFLKEICLNFIKTDYSELIIKKKLFLLILNITDFIYHKPESVNINIYLNDSISKCGFHSKDDIRETLTLLELKYDNMKELVKEEERINKKQLEIENLKKKGFFSSIKALFLWFEKVMIASQYNNFIQEKVVNFNKKLFEKEKSDKKRTKENRIDTDTQKVSDDAKISKIIENLTNEEKKLFNLIYNCVKNNGFVDFNFKENNLKVEIFIKSSRNDETPQM
ncbi:MAG TPA: hypothetical protein PK771_11235, partial [Spirochaetota bacterium]|nr:hypothetical protein [Spirochaetota bacterium]